MVYLSRIYTKSGDGGATGLGDGSRVSKDDPRIEAYGTVDELNAVIGLLRSPSDEVPEREILGAISNDLFDLGADLCCPEGPQAGARLRITPSHVARLEEAIDRVNAGLRPLTSFVLPGGTTASAWCHLARTVCRRAERRVVTLQTQTPVNPQVLIYLNRLSDLLFVLGRAANRGGADDVLWEPGKGATSSA